MSKFLETKNIKHFKSATKETYIMSKDCFMILTKNVLAITSI